LLVIWEENHNYGSIIGNPDAPEINSLVRQCALATNYHSLTHPSLPNYLEMTSGSAYTSWPWTSDCDPVGNCTATGASVFSELVAKGLQWRAYAEAMTSNCGLFSHDDYAARHNPAVYFASVKAKCQIWDQPMGSPGQGALRNTLLSGPSVALITVSPDLQDDMHNGPVRAADQWLARWLPRIIDSPAYKIGRLGVVIVWDEGSGSGNVPSHVPLIVMSSSTPVGGRSSASYTDFSVLQAACQLTGVPQLGGARDAASFVKAFGL
jgi:hypothetical protein